MAQSRYRLPSLFSRRAFRENAKQLKVSLGSKEVGVMDPRQHSTGSLGWRLDQKVQIKVGDHYVWAQVTTSVVLIGSKDLPNEPVQPAVAG